MVRLLAMVVVNAAIGQAKTCTTTRAADTDNYGKSHVVSAVAYNMPSLHT